MTCGWAGGHACGAALEGDHDDAGAALEHSINVWDEDMERGDAGTVIEHRDGTQALGLTSTVAKLLALGADIAAKDAVLDNVCFSLFQFFFPSSLPRSLPPRISISLGRILRARFSGSGLTFPARVGGQL